MQKEDVFRKEIDFPSLEPLSTAQKLFSPTL